MTSIEWCDETWNPVVGCSRVSEGCDNCYAIGVAHRQMQPAHMGLTKVRNKHARRPGVDWNGVVRCLPDRLGQPLRWRKPRRVFVNSMSDLFHEAVPFEFITAVYAAMAVCPRHTFIVLTKRPARAREFFLWIESKGHGGVGDWIWPLRNVILGVSTENQPTFDERVPLLLQCPAAVYAVSAEPLLGDIDMTYGLDVRERDVDGAWPEVPHGKRLGWVIVGGESGRGARPCSVTAIRNIVSECQGSSVPVFVKQLGAHPEGVTLSDSKGKDPEEWPEDVRVRQWPEVPR